jgi:hypothetical protein
MGQQPSLISFRFVSLFPSLFSSVGKEVKEWWDMVQEDIGYAGVTMLAL